MGQKWLTDQRRRQRAVQDQAVGAGGALRARGRRRLLEGLAVEGSHRRRHLQDRSRVGRPAGRVDSRRGRHRRRALERRLRPGREDAGHRGSELPGHDDLRHQDEHAERRRRRTSTSARPSATRSTTRRWSRSTTATPILQTSPFPNATRGFVAVPGIYRQDLGKAKEFLAKSAYPNGGLELEYVYVQGLEEERKMGLVLIDNLQKLNITVKMVPLIWPNMVGRGAKVGDVTRADGRLRHARLDRSRRGRVPVPQEFLGQVLRLVVTTPTTRCGR